MKKILNTKFLMFTNLVLLIICFALSFYIYKLYSKYNTSNEISGNIDTNINVYIDRPENVTRIGILNNRSTL